MRINEHQRDFANQKGAFKDHIGHIPKFDDVSIIATEQSQPVRLLKEAFCILKAGDRCITADDQGSVNRNSGLILDPIWLTVIDRLPQLPL